METCNTCNEPIETFDQWMKEDCQAKDQANPAKGGHDLTWPEIMRLQFTEGAVAEE